ncbi:MAG: M17 family peptidase N-terminal domain-containing protein, partial [Tumebacillaceae bacterium]
MNISIQLQSITDVETDVLVVNLFEGVKSPGGATGAVDAALGGQISALIETGDLTGRFKEVRTLYPFGKIKAKRVLIVGLGEAEEFNLQRARVVAAVAAKAARDFKAERFASIVHGAGSGNLDARQAAHVLAEGTLLGLYQVKHWRKIQQETTLTELVICEQDAAKFEAIQQGVTTGRIVAESTNFARALINEPANMLTPTRMAEY